MKIAILLRGQARLYSHAQQLFNHFTRDRHRNIEFEHHIYTWDSLTTSNSGVPTVQTTHNKGELLENLNNSIHPHSITVADERSHYNELICPWTQYYKAQYNIKDDVNFNSVRDHWVLNQIVADIRVQSQAYNYYLHKTKPDLIVDTRTEMAHWFEDGVLEKYSNVADNTVLCARSSVDEQGYRVVDDYTFIYNWNTLSNMCKHTPEQRLKNSLYSDIQTHMDLKLPHTNNSVWSSHTLYPVIVHKDQTYTKVKRDYGEDYAETVLDTPYDEELKRAIANSIHRDGYYDYSATQKGPQLDVNSQLDIASIHNSLTL